MKKRGAKRVVDVVLVSPRDPGNVGSAGRTCVGLGAGLQLVGPLGFQVDSEAALARAQLDYWDLLSWTTHRAWVDFVEAQGGLSNLSRRAVFFSAHHPTLTLGRQPLWAPDVLLSASSSPDPLLLVFGSETSGFRGLIPDHQLQSFVRCKIPMVHPDMRCYNLAVSVGMALWEAHKLIHVQH